MNRWLLPKFKRATHLIRLPKSYKRTVFSLRPTRGGQNDTFLWLFFTTNRKFYIYIMRWITAQCKQDTSVVRFLVLNLVVGATLQDHVKCMRNGNAKIMAKFEKWHQRISHLLSVELPIASPTLLAHSVVLQSGLIAQILVRTAPENYMFRRKVTKLWRCSILRKQKNYSEK